MNHPHQPDEPPPHHAPRVGRAWRRVLLGAAALLVVAAAVAGLAVAVGGGSGGSTVASPPPSSAAPNGADINRAAEDAVYVAAVRGHAPDLAAAPNTALAAIGRTVCAEAAAHGSLADLAHRLRSTYSAASVTVLIGTAPDVFCTDEDAAVDKALGEPADQAPPSAGPTGHKVAR